jgi:hypothetical protein
VQPIEILATAETAREALQSTLGLPKSRTRNAPLVRVTLHTWQPVAKCGMADGMPERRQTAKTVAFVAGAFSTIRYEAGNDLIVGHGQRFQSNQ